MRGGVVGVVVGFGLAGCAGNRCAVRAERLELVEAFPGVRVDRVARVVELEGRVATDVHDPQTPDVWLEVAVCTRDTREYESLVVIDAAAEHVQAALLLIGLMPGEPGRWEEREGGIVGVGPTGDAVGVEFVVDGCVVRPESWIVVGEGRAAAGEMDWVFAGSRFRAFGGREVYLAAAEGTVVGLTTFGSEIVGLKAMHHPESAVEEPSYLAKNDAVPGFGERVLVRLRGE